MVTVNPLLVTSPQRSWETKQVLGKDDFLKILITQLRHQDPLDPVENTEFIAQMAQLTSLEQLQDLNKNLDHLVFLQELVSGKEDLLFATSLLGKEAEAKNPSTGEVYKGEVQGYCLKEGEVWLIFAEHKIPAVWVYKAMVVQEGGGSQ